MRRRRTRVIAHIGRAGGDEQQRLADDEHAVDHRAPTIDPTSPQPPLLNANGANEELSGVAQLIGFGSTCTAFLVDAGALDEPATALTNGHCVGIRDARAVLVDQPVSDTVLRFRLFADTPEAVVDIPVTAIAYASMRISDVAVLELGATRRDLQDLSSYALGDPPSAGDPIEAVGVPTAGIPPEEWFLRASPCTARATVRLVEGKWLWDAAGSSDCPGILGGSSGSPVFAADDFAVAVGIVNTTTISAPPGGSCAVGRPCELSTGRAVQVANRSYFMPLATWEACWAPRFDIANDGCPAEQPPAIAIDAPRRAVQPGGTWSANIENGGPDRPTVVKTGPASAVDCRDPVDYGAPVTDPARFFDEPLPVAEDVYLLCAARTDADGAPTTAEAGYAVMEVDGTPPDAPIQLAASSDASGVRVQPTFALPEYAAFLVQVGPAGALDCSTATSYAPYFGIPLVVPAAELPATLCVIGEDEAGNRGAPQSFPLP